MSKVNSSKKKRKVYGKLHDVCVMPNLIDIQRKSFDWFVQAGNDGKKNDEGLHEVFLQTFPIISNDEEIILEYRDYHFGEPKYPIEIAAEKGLSFTIPLKVLLRLIIKSTGEVREKEIFMGDIPKMTDRGTFLINGTERVVVSQIHKSPGVVFSKSERLNQFEAKIIPEKGAWLEIELDYKKELINVRIDRKKKILLTTFLRSLGYVANSEIIDLFYDTKDVVLKDADENLISSLQGERIARNVVNPDEDGDVLFNAGTQIFQTDIDSLIEHGVEKISIVDSSDDHFDRCVLNCIQNDSDASREEAISRVHNVLKPGEPSTVDNASKEIEKIFFDPKKYNLGKVGRYKFNLKLFGKKNSDEENRDQGFAREDIIETIKYLIKVHQGIGIVDDIDHLGTRRIRSVGELLMNQLKVGFSRMERAVKERMNIEEKEDVTPQKLVSIKPITTVIKEFFGSSQLSQFMDQTNPLSELTHKRRLNALGPGGLSRERAGFEVRDVHYTHYGRMCPIETPEGPNIGLIVSLSNYAQVNGYGFLETPYRKCRDGVATEEVEYFDAIEEGSYNIAQASEDLDSEGRFTKELLTVRNQGDYPMVKPEEVDYMDVSPKQLISVSTSLIPFLEHDDANRALMGSNMQRQAVPLLFTDSPLVGTGMEARVAIDSKVCVISESAGEVVYSSSNRIKIKPDNGDELVTYNLTKYSRSNQDTCINQRPIVSVGEKVEEGEVLADGPACDQGELALGRNVFVAYMPWNGFNYEDAILISERIVKDDVFTSVHILEYEVEARETKLGKEEITSDIPNVAEKVFRNLDDDGIIRIGAKVTAGDMLVGRVTPKGETELTPEFKLLHSIFGEKSKDVKDTSLYMSNGSDGVVIDRFVYSRENGDELPPGVEKSVKIHVATKRKLSAGDKMAGRHGNKGVVSAVLPIEDMPFAADGTPVDIVLNPLGVPSRMNLGQILETLLGTVAYRKDEKIATPVFDGAKFEEIESELKSVGASSNGREVLYDGRTGKRFENEVTVGMVYMLKLSHLVDDKMHARSTGPYSLVTQQPLGGKAQFGGQRLGEMEVWAFEAYGAANNLQEFLTVKSDDMAGRAKIYESIVKGDYDYTPGIPESFNVLIQELRGLGLDLSIYNKNGSEVPLTEKDQKLLNERSLNKLKN